MAEHDIYYVDTETCGFHGPAILIQYAINEGPIILHDIWREPIYSTLELINSMCESTVIGFNLAFDWFHIIQVYTTLMQFEDMSVEPNILDYALYERKAPDINLCLKPAHCFDLFLHARKGPYQSTMDRKDIRIKRVPTALAEPLCEELSARITFPDVYFARRASEEGKKKRWEVRDIEDENGLIVKDFKDIVLSFAPSSALKALTGDIFGINTTKFGEINPPAWAKPVEAGWAPYAIGPHISEGKVIYTDVNRQGRYTDWHGKWPAVIQHHIDHWVHNEKARQYAMDDVKYTRDLYRYFESPEVDDTDSVLACMVAAVRWRGYRLSIDKLSRLSSHASDKVKSPPANFRSTHACIRYMHAVMNETEKLVLLNKDGKPSTASNLLKIVAKWELEEVCPECNGFGCDKCSEGVVSLGQPHPAAVRANEILSFRKAEKELQLYVKLLSAERFHASFKVIGTLSGRMAGADELNPQGINKSKEVRECFPLAWPGYQLVGGDFSGFEVCIADAAYNDPILHEELMSGKKMHGLFGVQLFPEFTYDQLLKDENEKYYGIAKQCVFAMLYGGDANTLNTRSGIPIAVAEEAYQRWLSKYKVWAQERQKYFDMFCSMRQPGGLGSKVEWHEPQEYVQSLLGFRRYFTLENSVCQALFRLSEKPPQAWNDLKVKVVRRDRVQTACGAVRSALLCAAFSAQSANMRAASNHVIQSTGAEMTKILQARIWGLQPTGIHRWVVQPMNIHDEILCPVLPEYVNDVSRIVKDFVEEYRSLIPMLKIDWNDHMNNWYEKKLPADNQQADNLVAEEEDSEEVSGSSISFEDGLSDL